MIISRALFGESARNALALVFVLVIIMVFVGLTGFLNMAVRGTVPQSAVLALLGFETLKQLDMLFTLGLYLGMLLALARWYRDSEMAVLAACGVSLTQLLRPALLLTALAVLVIAMMSFWVAPWAAAGKERALIGSGADVQPLDVAPGVFNESADGKRVYYAERVSRDKGIFRGVFVADSGEERGRVTVARRGRVHVDEFSEDRFLALDEGGSYEGTPGAADYRVTLFDKAYFLITSRPARVPPPRIESVPTAELLARTDRAARAELHWRLSKPLLAAVLVLFALVLAHTDPRRGRMANLFAAVLVYFICSNLLAYGATMLRKGLVPTEVGLWWVHALMFTLALVLFLRRAANRPLLAWPAWMHRRAETG